MMPGHLTSLLAAAVTSWAACQASPHAAAARSAAIQLQERERRFQERLATVAPGADRNKPLARWILPHELREISGLTLTADGTLLTHTDNRGTVYSIDPRRGEVLEHFSIGESVTRADFEGITVAEGTIYMLSSNGTLYEFEQGGNGAFVPFSDHDTQLGHQCEFEGVAYDRTIESLLLACKVVKTENLRDQLVIYRWKMSHTDRPRISVLTVPLSRVIGSNPWKGLHPSDITIEPSTGNYVLVAGRERALIEITPAGDVVRSLPLPGEHEAAEGLTITRDSILIVADEARNHAAQITLYRWPLVVPAPRMP